MPSLEELRRTALDSFESSAERESAIAELAQLRNRDSAEVLIELGSRSDDAEPILRAAGAALASLQEAGVPVSEWDIRDLASPAAEAFLE